MGGEPGVPLTCSAQMNAQTLPVRISERAAAELLALQAGGKLPEGYGLRLGTRGGAGCAGVSFVIGFDTEKEGDRAYALGPLAVYIARKDLMFLMGQAVDFIETDQERGFAFVDETELAQS